jgi:hypothetical protein
MVGRILILSSSISSVLALIHSSRSAGIATSIGFALMSVAAVIILLSLSCRIPSDFFLDMIVIPTTITVIVIVGLHVYYDKRRGGVESKH